ncbi:hypothetical protein [Clostridium tertium]|uniref:Uncharacterized protein n=1 Tax=Clostridium tertium TaxID=1559 RepID=A0A6N3FMR3_9CLOT
MFLVEISAIYIVIKVNMGKYITSYRDIWSGVIVGIWIDIIQLALYKELPKKEEYKEKIQ